MERISRFRAILFFVLFAFVLMLFAGRLFVMQIIETDGNNDNTQTYTTITTVRAARGDILDRNGNVLVGNRASYDLVFNHYVARSYGETNEALYRLIRKCNELGIVYNDHFPISKTRPFEYTLGEFTSSWQSHFQKFMVNRELDSDITAPLLLDKLRESYKIPVTWSEEDARAVVGIRYEFELRGITNLPTYTFLEDVSDQDLSTLLELNIPGLMVESSTVREYHTKYGAHILGYLGGMSDAQWAEFKEQGYSMDAMVGQAGFEEAFEDYLHGIDGQRVDIVSKDGAIIKQYWRDKVDDTGKKIGVYSPIAGNNVETTIDITLQEVTEKALDEVLRNIQSTDVNKATGEKQGHDVQGGAAVVMECKTGNILACASWPTYDLATMRENMVALSEDPMKPFFNRAFGAEYAPGSTYKMCTLIAAMENRNSAGNIIFSPGEEIVDTGIFDNEDYPGFHPTCLIWTSNPGVTHGTLTADKALAYSCNVFFYELGARVKWEMLDETAQKLGLGEPTGIELVEKTGRRNNPTTKKEVYKTGINAQFSGGDRILGAIGQAENRFTPLQLCVYASTLANKGTRMKATFLSRVVSSDYRNLIFENAPQIVSQMEMQYTTIEAYWTGMREVITIVGGTGAKFFGGAQDVMNVDSNKWPIEDGVWPLKDEVTVYAKTGTAQHSSGGSDHGALLCFAHRKEETEPDIAIAVFGEKAAHGNWLTPVAEKILMAY
ncbi:MAG: penicillin-binding transpeptidase domain-containing protein [Eubacteriales bacterium]|nr:penicillin-binding transpeptidase domain-containing protein [Eubacteriales bacterium]